MRRSDSTATTPACTKRSSARRLPKALRNVAVGDKGRVFNQALTFALELGYMLDCGEAIIRSALERKESRGAHTHVGLPRTQRRRMAQAHDSHCTHADGTNRMSYVPVTITRWKPEVRTY